MRFSWLDQQLSDRSPQDEAASGVALDQLSGWLNVSDFGRVVYPASEFAQRNLSVQTLIGVGEQSVAGRRWMRCPDEVVDTAARVDRRALRAANQWPRPGR